MKRILSIITVSICLIYFSCRKTNDVASSNENAPSIAKAKAWFDSYVSTVNNRTTGYYPEMVDNFKYAWDKAAIFQYKNGYKAITVPVIINHQDPAYTGRRILYLFPWKNGKGYYATIYELLPELDHVIKNKGNIDLKTFSGIISTWDLKMGFSRGIKFTNGVAEQNVKIEIKNIPPKRTGLVTQRTEDNVLPTVYVTGYRSSGISGFYWMTLMNSLGYSTDYLWGGGSGYNPCEYSGCGSSDPYDYFDPGTVNQISQDLLDQQWMNEIKDSTNKPCVTDVLSKLGAINAKLPALIRSFFNSDATFNMTIKMENVSNWGNGTAPEGGHTTAQTSSNNFNVFINNFYSDATDLASAAVIIHEAFHCQLLEWFREAVINNDQTRKDQLAADYGYIFSSEVISFDSSLAYIVNGGNANQHQDMIARFQSTIADALYQFAQAKGINVDLAYCNDLAWSGTFDSKAFKDLSYSVKDRITNRVNAEIDPNGNAVNPSTNDPLNVNNTTAKGHPCQ